MVSVTGTQHRHAAAGATKQTQGGDDAPTRGRSEASVGHMAKALVERPDIGTYTGPSAQGQAAAYIAKLSLDARAELLESLKTPAPDQPTTPTDETTTPPTDETTPPTDDTTTPPTDDTTTPPTDETTTPPTDETTTPVPPPTDTTTDAAITILGEIIAAAEENDQPA